MASVTEGPACGTGIVDTNTVNSSAKRQHYRFSKRVLTSTDKVNVKMSSQGASIVAPTESEIKRIVAEKASAPERKLRATEASPVPTDSKLDAELKKFLPPKGDIGYHRVATRMPAKTVQDTEKRRVKPQPDIPAGIVPETRDKKDSSSYQTLPTDQYRRLAEQGKNWGIGEATRLRAPK